MAAGYAAANRIPRDVKSLIVLAGEPVRIGPVSDPKFPANREINREFPKNSALDRNLAQDHRANPTACRQFPCYGKQGISKLVTGKFPMAYREIIALRYRRFIALRAYSTVVRSFEKLRGRLRRQRVKLQPVRPERPGPGMQSCPARSVAREAGEATARRGEAGRSRRRGRRRSIPGAAHSCTQRISQIRGARLLR